MQKSAYYLAIYFQLPHSLCILGGPGFLSTSPACNNKEGAVMRQNDSSSASRGLQLVPEAAFAPGDFPRPCLLLPANFQ